jgi:HD superfamily phosphodiesterase
MEKKIESIRNEIYELFRQDTGERKYSYVRRDWVFPNHFDVMIDLSKEMCNKYGGDEDICEIAILLHDVGLVYERKSASPEGHEERGIEYARKILNKNVIPSQTQEKIIECIRATDAQEEPSSINAKIVRTADALSQFISVHFFAKAAFSGDWDNYVGWLKKKATNNFKKICFEDEIKRATPMRDYILSAVEIHEKNQINYPKKSEGKNAPSKID